MANVDRYKQTNKQKLNPYRLAQLGLQGFDLRSQGLHLICLRCNGLGLQCDKGLDLADFATHCIGCDGRRLSRRGRADDGRC